MQTTINIETSVQLNSGRYICLLNPNFSGVAIEDIAHALSKECRFNGNCNQFYSVAEHSVRASYLMSDHKVQYQTLMHDAAEAITGDIISPIKALVPILKDIENKIMFALAKRFLFDWPMVDAVKNADLVMLATERRDLMPADSARWLALDGIEPYPDKINPWDQRYAYAKFLDRFDQLFLHVPAYGERKLCKEA